MKRAIGGLTTKKIGPIKYCSSCGHIMQSSLESDAITHDGWKHIKQIHYWLYHCNNCQQLDDVLIIPNEKEKVQFT